MAVIHLSEEQIDQYKKDGYLIVKNVFSKAEALELRKWVQEDFESVPDDKKIVRTKKVIKTRFSNVTKLNYKELLCSHKLRNVILDSRIIGIAKSILGEKIAYFGDSNYQIGLRMSPFHRDSPDRFGYGEGDDWKSFYDGIRFGIYLEDHKDHADGLVVKKGSHIAKDGKVTFVDTELGDVVFWNLRLYHKGNADRLRIFKNVNIPYVHRMPAFLKLPSQAERIAIFFTFFKSGSIHLNNFIQFLKDHPTELEIFRNSQYGKEVQDKIDQFGIEIAKPVPEYGYNP